MNPELQRNLWLEFTLHRLLAMPVILALAFMAVAAADSADRSMHINTAALAGFGLLTLLWGTRLSANTVLDELVDKTWDWQRLSTLSPWTMTWGKLFGATAFAWYGGLLCMLVFLVTEPAIESVSPFKLMLMLLFLGVFLHATTIASSLHLVQKTPVLTAQNRRSFGILIILAVLWGAPFSLMHGFRNGLSVEWYHSTYQLQDFLLISVAVFALWSVLGAYRVMCQNLAVRTTPWVWVSFLLFVSAYFAGFMLPSVLEVSAAQALFFSGLVFSVAFSYVMLFSESSGPIVIKRVLQKVRRREWRRAWEETPLWPLTWMYAAVCAVALALLGFDAQTAAGREFSLGTLPLVLLVARDAGILLFFASGAKPKRVIGATLIYLLVLYWLIPMLLFAMDLEAAAKIVLPLGWGNNAVQIASAAVQATIALVLAVGRIRRNFAAYKAADGA